MKQRYYFIPNYTLYLESESLMPGKTVMTKTKRVFRRRRREGEGEPEHQEPSPVAEEEGPHAEEEDKVDEVDGGVEAAGEVLGGHAGHEGGLAAAGEKEVGEKTFPKVARTETERKKETRFLPSGSSRQLVQSCQFAIAWVRERDKLVPLRLKIESVDK